MANRRLLIREIKEVLRLNYDCVFCTTIADYLMKAQAVGLSWPKASMLTMPALRKGSFRPNLFSVR
jgi:hypothetical protein